jgi:peptidoglycan hydrolase CwlO-like protein
MDPARKLIKWTKQDEAELNTVEAQLEKLDQTRSALAEQYDALCRRFERAMAELNGSVR